MKCQKLLISAATACLLLGAAGTAMAVDCAAGFINNETVDEITVNGRHCFVSETIVNGNVTVTDSPTFIMTNNRVLGSINVTSSTGSGQVLLKDNELFSNPIQVNNVSLVWIFANVILGDPNTSNMVFENNTDEVQVFNNKVDGDLLCANNNFAIASGNVVLGDNTCPNSIQP